MKKINCCFLVGISFLFHSAGMAQADSLSFAGDNLDLRAVLFTFEKSSSIEEFEKLLNTKESEVNNLDLNEDGKVDFIRVQELRDEEARTVVMTVDLSATESQDVAVILMERTATDEVHLQIIGEDEVYGTAKKLEPSDEQMKGGKGGPFEDANIYYPRVNVRLWPCVRGLYDPHNRPYHNRWAWGRFPPYWLVWGLMPPTQYFYVIESRHLSYRPSVSIFCSRAHGLWYPHRAHCARVHQRYLRDLGRHRAVNNKSKANQKDTEKHSPKNGKVQPTPKKAEGSKPKAETKPKASVKPNAPGKPAKQSGPSKKNSKPAKASKPAMKPAGGSGGKKK
jgi:hypothetical protein